MATQKGQQPAKGTAVGTVEKADSLPIPDYIKNSGTARGSENVGTKDITIPRIEVAQALSKCLKESDPGHIDGAKQGHLYNSVTRNLYGSSAVIVPIMFKREYLIWKNRQKGGGFRGAFDTEEAALRAKKLLDDGADCEVQETHQQFVLVVDNKRIDEAVISMSRSKLKASRNFNSLVRMNGGDRFSRSYRVGSVAESNDKGDYFSLQFANHGFPAREAYEKAERLYDMIAAGIATVDRTYEEDDDGHSGDSEM